MTFKGGDPTAFEALRSKSYVQRLPDVDRFVRDSLSVLRAVFGDGPVIEPFVTRLWRFTA